jgi:hypothetical protein
VSVERGPNFAHIGNVLGPFLRLHGGVLLSHAEWGRTGAYRDEFEVFGESFVLNCDHYRNGSMIYHVAEDGRTSSLLESLRPFRGSIDEPEEVLEYLKSRPRWETGSDYLQWLLDQIPEFIALPAEQRCERKIEGLIE